MPENPRIQALHELSQFMVAEKSLGDTLQRVVDLTADALPPVAMAGLAMLDEAGCRTTAIATEATVPEIDTSQWDTGRGPCLDAWRTRHVVRVDDLAAATDVYPEFCQAAKEVGVKSTLSLPLVAGDEGIGTLNLYARTLAAFSAEDEAVGLALAAVAAVVLANSSAYWGAQALSEQLSEAMQSRAVIEQAKGILMAHSPGLSPDDAFNVLRRASQRENRKLREIARRIVEQRSATGTGSVSGSDAGR